jgi:hypothetical protein
LPDFPRNDGRAHLLRAPVSPAALRWGDVCDEPRHGPRDPGANDDADLDHGPICVFIIFLLTGADYFHAINDRRKCVLDKFLGGADPRF